MLNLAETSWTDPTSRRYLVSLSESEQVRELASQLIADRPEKIEEMLGVVHFAQNCFDAPDIQLKFGRYEDGDTLIIVAITVLGDFDDYAKRDDEFTDWILDNQLDEDADISYFPYYACENGVPGFL